MSTSNEFLKDTFGGKVLTNQDFISSFLQARDWLSAKGINIDNTRFTHCQKLLASEGEVSWDKLWAHTELHDLVEIFENIASLESTRLLDSLKKLATGPILLREEAKSGGSIHGRNYTFELYTASRLSRAGFNVTFDTESDVNFFLKDNLIHTECKRVNSPDKLESLVKKAHQQIRTRCDLHRGRGLVSLSISKLIHQALIQDEFGQPQKDLYANHSELQHLMRECVAKWSQLIRAVFKDLEPMCIGVLLHYKMPFIDRSTNAPSFLNRFSLIPYDNSELNSLLAKHISHAMSDSVIHS